MPSFPNLSSWYCFRARTPSPTFTSMGAWIFRAKIYEHGGHTQTYHDFDAPWWFGSRFNEVGHSRPTHPLVQAWARETFGTEGRRVLLLNCREDLMTCGEESRDSLEYASNGPSSMTDELLGDLQTTFLLQMLWMFCMGQALMTTSTGSNVIE